MENVKLLIQSLQSTKAEDLPTRFQNLDQELHSAATKDMMEFWGLIFSTILSEFYSEKGCLYRKVDVFTAFGWTPIFYPYTRGCTSSSLLSPFGIEEKMTRFASTMICELSVKLASFRETAETIRKIEGIYISASKIRKETLRVGNLLLEEQKKSIPEDIRDYSLAKKTPSEDIVIVPRTLVCQADGTNIPCVKADTKGIKGKNGGEAGSRQLRVIAIAEYDKTTAKGVPIPYPKSFSYAVSDGDITELTDLLTKCSIARGVQTVPRVQCIADGEDALRTALQAAIPQENVIFTNDIMHALEYLHELIIALNIENPEKEYTICKRIMYRHGASSCIGRIERLYLTYLESSTDAKHAIEYLRKRQKYMQYGKLRSQGYYISSAHVEAAARIIVGRRCKQAGMHWRHHNAACICAIVARIRSSVV